MTAPKRISQTLLERVRGGTSTDVLSRLDRAFIGLAIGIGVGASGWLTLIGRIEAALFFLISTGLFVGLAAMPRLQLRQMGRRLGRRHALYLLFFWVYAALVYLCARGILVPGLSPVGKESASYHALAFLVVAGSWMALRSLFAFTRRGYTLLITGIPMWEQVLVMIDEIISVILLAIVGADMAVRVTQPAVFTLTFDPIYNAGLLGIAVLFFLAMQAMWWRRWNDWISRTPVWVQLARLITPFAFAVVTMIIARRFLQRADPRTAGLLGSDTSLAVLAIAPVALLVTGALLYLLFTSSRGLRQRFLPDLLLERLPKRISERLSTISDMDMTLILGLFASLIPIYLLLRGGTGIVDRLRDQILQQGSALIETSEQALALLFAAPFYLLIVALLILYAIVISRRGLSADDRERLIRSLPVGFLIVLVITLYLFAVPFSQVVTEGRLPQLPQDLGRILAFNVVVPLALLYTHYFLLVRFPYGRGQSLWRGAQSIHLNAALDRVDRRIQQLNEQLRSIDQNWTDGGSTQATDAQIRALHRYVQLNSQRDDLNMQRLQILGDRQALAEVSETPISVAVARLPLRVVSLGIPLLIVVQLYQWAIVNNGLRAIVNDPNLTVFDFFRAILKQLQF